MTSHPLLQRFPRQSQCPIHNCQQNQLLNLLSEIPHQHTVTTPQVTNQAYNAPVSTPHQCIPVTDQENQQFLSKVLENRLVKALREQNSQHLAQHSGHQPHIVNNYFIIPTEALLSEEDGKKDKAKDVEKEKRNNNERNHATIKSSKDNDETHKFLVEYLNEPPKEDLKSKTDVQKKKVGESHKCSENEKSIEVVLEPTFANIQEQHETKSTSHQTQIDADEALIQDVRNKFPNMPESLVRSLISVMKHRLQRFNPYQNFRHPNRQRVISHNHGNSTIDERENWHQRPGQRRPFRRNPNRRRKLSNRNATVTSDIEGTTKKYEKLDLKEATQVQPPATEFYRVSETTTENPVKNRDGKDVSKSKLVENTTPYVVYASRHATELPELGTEDIIPNVDNGINDDYYPDFTKDNKARAVNDAFSNYPEFYDEVVKSERKISNDRVTQRGKHLDGKKTPKKVMRKLSERPNKAKYHEKKHEDVEDVEEIVYRVPPGLESPDFKTVNVREYHHRDYQRPTYFSHEREHFEGNTERATENEVNASNDEPTITYYITNKPLETKRKKGNEKIETVFANSKIMNYGHSSDAYDGETTTIANMFTVNIAKEGTENPFGVDTVLPKAYVESEEFNW